MSVLKQHRLPRKRLHLNKPEKSRGSGSNRFTVLFQGFKRKGESKLKRFLSWNGLRNN